MSSYLSSHGSFPSSPTRDIGRGSPSPPPLPKPNISYSVQLQYHRGITSKSSNLKGDKIILPQSVLQELLSSASAAASNYWTGGINRRPAGWDVWDERQGRPQEEENILPHPIIFKVFNPRNNRFTHAVPREFSAEEGEIAISDSLREALGIDDVEGGAIEGIPEVESSRGEGNKGEQATPLTVIFKPLPKGTSIRLRPLEAGYGHHDTVDWKALLERELRMGYSTLTVGEILSVSSGGRGEKYRFLLDKVEPEGQDGICVVDTDVEVEIVPLSEEQARETLRRKLEYQAEKKSQKLLGGPIKVGQVIEGEVSPGQYLDFQLQNWDTTQPLIIQLSNLGDEDAGKVDLFVSTSQHHHQSGKGPREEEHVWGDMSSSNIKRIEIGSGNIELQPNHRPSGEIDILKNINISVHGYLPPEDSPDLCSPTATHFTLQISQDPSPSGAGISSSEQQSLGQNYTQCSNCGQAIPQQSFIIHTSFCFRNNIKCPHPGCKSIFKRGSVAEKNHWHCTSSQTCTSSGSDGIFGQTKHAYIFHSPRPCPFTGPISCSFHAENTPQLSLHATTTCPNKLILCAFCHLLVPQEAEATTSAFLLSTLSPHEYTCGSRTTNCHLCTSIIKLKDLPIHLKTHDLERKSKPTPRTCRNVNCCRTLPPIAAASADNELGLCGICFSPFYAPGVYDPTKSRLRSRVERKYVSQMVSGCGRDHCTNYRFCATAKRNVRDDINGTEKGRENGGVTAKGSEEKMTIAKALPIIKPITEKLFGSVSDNSNSEDGSDALLSFCVDEMTSRRRMIGEALSAEGGYEFGWGLKALEESGGDVEGARKWLERWGVKKSER